MRPITFLASILTPCLLLLFALAPPLSAQIHVPTGYRAVTYRVDDLAGPTGLAFDRRGRLFVVQMDGRILILEDADHDGIADPVAKVYKTGLKQPHGLAFLGNVLYVTAFDKVIALEDRDGDDVAEVETDIVTGLPVGAAPNIHCANGIAIGPDGKVYFSLGSTCDKCDEPDPRSATILRVDPDGQNLEIFASGLRNVFDFAFNAAGDLFCGDNQFNFGSDDNYPPDELNFVRYGLNYGWPNYEGNPPPGSGTEPPVTLMPPHCSPDGMCFYEGLQFPGMRDEGFITLWGQVQGPWSGHTVQRLHLKPDGNGGYTAQPENFVTGLYHPLDVASNKTGDLFVAEYGVQNDPPTDSAIYRIEFVDLTITSNPSIGGLITFTLNGQPQDRYVLFGSIGSGYISLGTWGAFRLDPSMFYPVALGTLPSTGSQVLAGKVPNDPNLIGLTFHHQLARTWGGNAYLGVDAPVTIGP
jgi:glucose/arabinose dehydrogenase